MAGLMSSNILLTLLSSMLFARILGPEDFGDFTFVLAVVAFLALPTKAGLPDLLVREVAKYQLSQSWGLIKGILKLANAFVLLYTLIVMIGAVAFVGWYWSGEESSRAAALLWALCLLPLIAFEGVRSGALRGFRWVVSSAVSEQLVKPLVLVLCLGVSVLVGAKISPITAVHFNILAGLVALVVGVFFLYKAVPVEVRDSGTEYAARSWAGSLAPLALFAGLQMLDSQISILLLGALATSEDVALFRIAVTGAGLVVFGLMAVNMALAPQVSRLYNSGEFERLQKVITLSTRLVAVISFPVALVFILWGEALIAIVFGDEYRKAGLALSILCVGQIVNSAAGSVGLVLNMTGHDRKTLPAVLAAVIANIVISIVLIPGYGYVGAAIGYSASLVIWNLILVVVTKKTLGINTFVLSVSMSWLRR